MLLSAIHLLLSGGDVQLLANQALQQDPFVAKSA